MSSSINVIVIIDAFRAFATASYVLKRSPASYILTTKSSVISRLSINCPSKFLIGKPEKGVDFLNYHIPNSPTRVKQSEINGKHVFHRTEAGAKGILRAKGADMIFAAGFTNADATVSVIQDLDNPKVTIIPMGHEAETPSLEDELCALYIDSLLKGSSINLEQHRIHLKEGPGRYFFLEDQWQYPEEDFERCLETQYVNFAIQAYVEEDFAILKPFHSAVTSTLPYEELLERSPAKDL